MTCGSLTPGLTRSEWLVLRLFLYSSWIVIQKIVNKAKISVLSNGLVNNLGDHFLNYEMRSAMKHVVIWRIRRQQWTMDCKWKKCVCLCDNKSLALRRVCAGSSRGHRFEPVHWRRPGADPAQGLLEGPQYHFWVPMWSLMFYNLYLPHVMGFGDDVTRFCA